MKLKGIIGVLEEIAPLDLQESYDNAGLLIGDINMEISGAMCTLDSTEEILDEAIDNNCNLIIAHHPIIFGGIKKFTNYYVHRVIKKAIKNDIAIYAIHTNLDNVLKNGVNEMIGQKLGLINMTPLRGKSNPNYPDRIIGSGVLGELKNDLEEKAFLNHIQKSMSCSIIKHTKLLGKKINRVACCGGSGSFLLKDAIAQKADIFITSDFKYHEFFDADGQIVIADIGHYETEHYTQNLLCEILNNKLPNFAARYSNLNTNPVFYHQ